MRISFILVSLLFSQLALAFPLPKPGTFDSVRLPKNFTADFNFEGIVSLSNCSGSLIRLENAKDTDFALILTNGHCRDNGFPPPGQHISNEPSSRRFGLMNANGDTVGRVNASMLVYSTMTGTDMSIYKLRETYAEILSRYQVRPFTLSSTKANIGQEIEVVSGYWNRGFRCAIEAFVHELREDDFTMHDSIRYTRPGCEVYGGTSGSPIIAKNTRTVIGVNNTGNESGYRCTMNNPCEVDEAGNIKAVRGYSYGQQTYWVYSCLNSANEIDLRVPGCKLAN